MSDDQNLVIKALGEERANGAVDETAGESLLLGGAALALEEAARDPPGGREFFLIVHGQREEILPRLDVLRGRDGAKDDGLAEGRENRAVGLAGDSARLEGQRLAAPLDFHFLHVEHSEFPSTPGAECAGGLLSGLLARLVGPYDPNRTTAELRAPDMRSGPVGGRSGFYLRSPSFAMSAV